MEAKETKWRKRAFQTWTLVGLCILIGVAIYISKIVWQAVAVVIVTILVVFLLHGIVNKLEEKGLPRWAGTTIAFLIVLLVIVGCILSLIPAIVQQLTSFTNQLPTYISELQIFISNLDHDNKFINGEAVNSALASFSTFIRQQAGIVASGLASGVMGGIVSAGNVLLVTFISLICSFWILLDLPTITHELRMLVSDKYQDDLNIFANAFGTAVYGWAKSTLLCAIITGIVSWLAFLILGIPYSAVLGFLCGILYFIPYIGPMVSCALVAVIALFVSPLVCIISIVVNMVINNLVGNVISPKLMKSSVNVYPALILIAILVGSALGGIPGMLLSIPIIGAMQGVFVTYFEARTGKQLATVNGALFQKPTEKVSWRERRAEKKDEKDAKANEAQAASKPDQDTTPKQ